MKPDSNAGTPPTITSGAELRGTTALLTGVGQPGQLGETVAGVFAQRGVNLVLVARRTEQTQRVAAQIRKHGVETHLFSCDLADFEAVRKLAANVATVAPMGLSALVHMAGGYVDGSTVAESDPRTLDHLFSINAVTAFATSSAFLPLVRKARGSMVFFASTAAFPGASVARMSAYAAAKSAVVTLARAIAAEEKSTGVRANALAPLAIRTSSNESSMGSDRSYVERETVAEWIWWLCSAASGPVSGQIIRLG